MHVRRGACSCGCFVVSTNVGGVPEVLPPHLVALADPTPDSIERALRSAIEKVRVHVQRGHRNHVHAR